MSALGQVAGEAMVEWLALRAGSRLLLMPKAEAMELAPKQSAEADDPLASRKALPNLKIEKGWDLAEVEATQKKQESKTKEEKKEGAN